RNGIEQGRVHPAKDCAVGPDAEPQGQHGDGREPWVLTQHAQAVADILEQSFQHSVNSVVQVILWVRLNSYDPAGDLDPPLALESGRIKTEKQGRGRLVSNPSCHT